MQKKRLFNRMQLKHAELLQQLKGKKKIKVVFLAIHKSVWKVDPVFKKMLEDPFFEPLVLVCPYTLYGEERMRQDMQECYEYFQDKGYPVLSSYHKEENRWITLKEIQPDVVFFTNPHNLTRKEYYEDAYLNYLSCYSGYGIAVSRYNNYESQYNQFFHNAMWRIFLQHKNGMQISKKYACNKGLNCVLVGDTTIEVLIEPTGRESVWKQQSKPKLKIIWAPHHTITQADQAILPYSSFLTYCNVMMEIAEEFREDIQIAFKPHPILKSKLYELEGWGKEKTDQYYSYWDQGENTQYESGDYLDLFKQSDAMVHDSAAFTVEYLFLNKPVMHLAKKGVENFFNDIAIDAYNNHYKAKNAEDIIKFINKYISEDSLLKARESFIKRHSYILGATNQKPSDLIIKNLKGM